MPTIPISEVKPLYTTLIAARYDELNKIKATGALRGMFKDNITRVMFPSYDVRRGSEKVALNVVLGHQGVRTQITKATQKILDPFYFRLYFDSTQLECYWNLFGSTSISENVMTEFVDGVATATKANQDMIERAQELWSSEVLEFGTCTSSDGSVADFKRKAASMVNTGAGTFWADAGIDPYAQLGDGGTFIRKYGKYMGGVFNVTMGEQALADFLNNPIVKARNDLKMWKLDNIVTPDMNAEGMVYHGTITCGSYTMHIWTYPQFYEDASNGNALTAYWPTKKVVITVPNPEFQFIYAATPQLITPGQSTASLIASKFVMSEYIDLKARAHEFHIESRGLPTPLAVDTIYTRQVVA
jgi:hypothetical protein